LGFKQILLVGHDVGSQPAYSYAAAHPREVRRLVIMEYFFPGFNPPPLQRKVWSFPFHQTPDIPEALVEGKERCIYHGSIITLHIIHLQSRRQI
jgi:pimeloyl-ACP methyl ester carboxylesterase